LGGIPKKQCRAQLNLLKKKKTTNAIILYAFSVLLSTPGKGTSTRGVVIGSAPAGICAEGGAKKKKKPKKIRGKKKQLGKKTY